VTLPLDCSYLGMERLQILQGWAGAARKRGAVWWGGRHDEILQCSMSPSVKILSGGRFPWSPVSTKMAKVELWAKNEIAIHALNRPTVMPLRVLGSAVPPEEGIMLRSGLALRALNR
jgi:hypothetical protein